MEIKTKIFLLSHTMTIDGVATSLLGLLKELDYSAVDVDLMLMSPAGPLMSEIPLEVNLLPTPNAVAYYWNRRPKNLLPSRLANCIYYVSLYAAGLWYKIFRRMKIDNYGRGLLSAFLWDFFLPKRITEGQYDLALFFSCQPVMVGRVKAKKSAVWVHTDWGNFHPIKWLMNRFFPRADYIVNVSSAAKESFDRYLKPCYRNKSVVVENCLSSKWMLRKSEEGDVPSTLKTDCFKILSVGRISAPKCFKRAAKAANILKQRGVNFKWVVVGDGELRKSIENTDLILVGQQTNPYPYYKWCDLLVCTSDWEGKSVAVREAQVFAKSVVCTKFPTASSQIADGVDGLLVDRTPEAVAEGVMRVVEDGHLRRELSENCSKRDYANLDGIDKILSWVK